MSQCNKRSISIQMYMQPQKFCDLQIQNIFNQTL